MLTIVRKKRGQALIHMPLHVIRQDAQKHMSTDTIIRLVINRAHFQLNRLQIAKGILHQRQALVRRHQRLLGHALRRHRPADNVAAVKALLSGDLFLIETPLKTPVLNAPDHELTHPGLGQQAPHPSADFFRIAWALGLRHPIQFLACSTQQGASRLPLALGALRVAAEAIPTRQILRIDDFGNVIFIKEIQLDHLALEQINDLPVC